MISGIPMIEAEGVRKRYPGQDRDAVQEVSLSVSKGELFGLVGADGAGKTTLLRILATVLPATAGTVTVAGFSATNQRESIRSSVGYMPQSFSLYGDLTATQNLEFFADINGVPRTKREERIRELEAFTRLGDVAHRAGRTLSGGQKKKLALACALVHEPEVLILDEPSTGVDPVSRRELWAILGRVVAEGVAVIASTPYMDEAERCHRVAVMDEGRVLAMGVPGELSASLPYQVLEVRATPRREMRRAVGEAQDVLDWRPVGDVLRVSVSPEQAETVQTNLRADLDQAGAQVHRLRLGRRTMEDVFVHLIRRDGEKEA